MSHWLIVGASRGIGLEAARQLSARGERVTASVRSAAGLAALKAAAPQAATLQFDVRDEAEISAAAAQVCDPIDVLIANAGAYGPQRQSSTDMDFEGALDLLSVNTLGPLRVVQAFLPLVKRERSSPHRVDDQQTGLDVARRDGQCRLPRLESGSEQDRAMSR